MSEIKRKIETFMVEYICDDCKKGCMVFLQKKRPAIKKGSFYNIHQCERCGKIKEYLDITYPYKQHEVIKK